MHQVKFSIFSLLWTFLFFCQSQLILVISLLKLFSQVPIILLGQHWLNGLPSIAYVNLILHFTILQSWVQLMKNFKQSILPIGINPFEPMYYQTHKKERGATLLMQWGMKDVALNLSLLFLHLWFQIKKNSYTVSSFSLQRFASPSLEQVREFTLNVNTLFKHDESRI